MGANNAGDLAHEIAAFALAGGMFLIFLGVMRLTTKRCSQSNQASIPSVPTPTEQVDASNYESELDMIRASIRELFREEVASSARAVRDRRLQQRCEFIASRLQTKTHSEPGNVNDKAEQSCDEENLAAIENNEEDQCACAICLNPYRDGEQISCSPNVDCNHQFHHDCIAEWLLTHEECPFCRHVFLSFADEAGMGKDTPSCIVDDSRNNEVARASTLHSPAPSPHAATTTATSTADDIEEVSEHGLSC